MPTSGTRAFLDTNVLVYSFDRQDPKRAPAKALLAEGGFISVQVLNEFVAILVRKAKKNWPDVLAALGEVRLECETIVPLTIILHEKALKISMRYGFRIYDSLIVAAALEAECGVLYAEDMQDGQVIENLTIRDPFRSTVQ